MPKTPHSLVDYATLVAAVSAVIVAAMVVVERWPGASATSFQPVREVADWTSYTTRGNRLGPVDAPVTIVEWGDFECSACRAVEPHLRAVRRKYPDDVAILYRHWPLEIHPLAYPAARAAECSAQQGRFEEYHRLLYDKASWRFDPRSTFIDFAEDAGVSDVKAFTTCLDSDEAVPAIEEDIAAVMAVGGTGTPTLLVNNVLVPGIRDSTFLEELVLDALNH